LLPEELLSGKRDCAFYGAAIEFIVDVERQRTHFWKRVSEGEAIKKAIRDNAFPHIFHDCENILLRQKHFARLKYR
jgi:hypothetical protein